MNIPLIDLKAQHQTLRTEINQAIQTVLDRTDFILGQDVTKFEEEFASYCGIRYAVGVSSGLAALELILLAFGIGPGDEVIVPAHTFTATAAAVTFSGAKPIFVDVNPDTWTIDPEKIEQAITPHTKAIIPVHLYGLPADMDEILAIAKKHDLIVVEDACQGHGSKYKGKLAGNLGHAAAFSFYPTKNLGACGDAGMITTNDERIAESARAMRNCGQRVKNVHEMLPFNHRMDNIQAAILRVKLPYLNQWLDARRRLAGLYNQLLAGMPLVTPLEPAGYYHIYHLYVVRAQDRDGLQNQLKERGIGTAVHYPIPVHLQPFFLQNGQPQGSYPIAEKLCGEILSLPMYPEMTDEQVEIVASEMKAVLTVAG